METIGKLTGGVAHDFDNLLQIIAGNLQLLEMDTGGPEVQRWIGNARSAVEKGAKLASYLLAFGRRQPLEPKVVKIGRVVTGRSRAACGALPGQPRRRCHAAPIPDRPAPTIRTSKKGAAAGARGRSAMACLVV